MKNEKLRIYIVYILLISQWVFVHLAFAAPLKIVFCSNNNNSNGGTLRTVDLDGTNLTTIRTAPNGNPDPFFMTAGQSIRGCTYDSLTDRVYFSEGLNIIRTSITNTSATTLQSPGGNLFGLAVDSQASRMYWSDSDNDAIKYASSATASDSVTTLVSGPHFAETRDLEVDHENSALYAVTYSTSLSSWSIVKVTLSGGFALSVVTGLTSPNGIALDVANNRLFYTDAGTAKIWRADLNGSNQVDLTAVVGGVVNPQDIDYDPETGKIYWLDNGTSIKSSNPDGTSVQTVVSGIDRVVHLSFYNPDLTTLQPTLTNPQTGSTYATNLPIEFTLPEAALSGSTRLSFRQGGSGIALLTMIDASSVSTIIQPFTSSVGMNSAVVSASGFPIAEGTYDITLSYQDAKGNTAASVTNAGVVLAIATSTPTSTPTHTVTPTPSAIPTSIPSSNPTVTPTPTNSPSPEPTATETSTPEVIATPLPPTQLRAPRVKVKANTLTINVPAQTFSKAQATIYIRKQGESVKKVARKLKLTPRVPAELTIKILIPDIYNISYDIRYTKNKSLVTLRSAERPIRIRNITR